MQRTQYTHQVEKKSQLETHQKAIYIVTCVNQGEVCLVLPWNPMNPRVAIKVLFLGAGETRNWYDE